VPAAVNNMLTLDVVDEQLEDLCLKLLMLFQQHGPKIDIIWLTLKLATDRMLIFNIDKIKERLSLGESLSKICDIPLFDLFR